MILSYKKSTSKDFIRHLNSYFYCIYDNIYSKHSFSDALLNRKLHVVPLATVYCTRIVDDLVFQIIW